MVESDGVVINSRMYNAMHPPKMCLHMGHQPPFWLYKAAVYYDATTSRQTFVEQPPSSLHLVAITANQTSMTPMSNWQEHQLVICCKNLAYCRLKK